MQKLKVGIIGFGLSGRFFHGPLIQSHPGFQLRVLSTSRTQEVQSFLADVTVVSDPYELILDKNLDVIINCAPNSHHFIYTEAALRAGKHVVVEKPFVNTIEEGQKLISLANHYGKILSVFHNRRWDNDFLTVRALINSGKLGEIKQFESHFDRWRPTVRPERWREQNLVGSGVFYDLGAHLIDQALVLFGSPTEVWADITIQKPEGKSDDYFHMILKYGQLRVILHGTSFSKLSPRFQIWGQKGNFVKYGFDPQEDQLKQNLSPHDSNFGIEIESQSGQVYWPENDLSEVIKSERGCYLQFYNKLYHSITERFSEVPVAACDALKVIKIIELAQESSRSGKTLKMEAAPENQNEFPILE